MYWLGGFTGGNNVWGVSDGSTSSNWTTDAAGTQATSLVPGPTTTVNFSPNGAANQGATVLGTSMSVLGLAFSDTAAVSLQSDGNSLTIGGSGIAVGSGAGMVTLAAPITLGAAQQWTNNASNPLWIAGPVANSGKLLTVGGSGNTVVNAAISGAGGLTKTDAGTLVLGSNHTYAGATNINGGTLKAGIVLNGFGSGGAGWTGNGAPAFASDGSSLTLTFNTGGEGRSAFYNTPVPTGAFTASFIYQATGTPGQNWADGSAFVLQNSTAGAVRSAAPGASLDTRAFNPVRPSNSMFTPAAARSSAPITRRTG